jgi:hypothetical protein
MHFAHHNSVRRQLASNYYIAFKFDKTQSSKN